MLERELLYIDGSWVRPSSTDAITVVDPATELMIGKIPIGGSADVERAVAAARAAAAEWALIPVARRAEFVQAIAEGLGERGSELADLITHEVGMPRKLTESIQVGLPTTTFRALPALLTSFPWEEEVGNSVVLREPVGVVGAITPWNYPLHQIAAKVAPALGAGCTVILKPSEVAPLNAFLLAEIIDRAGLPPGVFNLVTGTGPGVGEAIARHDGIDMVSFTGSTAAGRRVSELAAATVKQVSLELGGKSASIVLEDADLERAVRATVSSCFLNSGQTCSALTRLIVPRASLPTVEQLTADAAERFTPGDPFDPATRLGPLTSGAQLSRVRGYIERGLAEGARLVTGGAERPGGLPVGYFVRPTVFSDVRPGMTIAQEEIFGPVLAILPYDSELEALDIANDSPYGLAGAIWSSDPDRAKTMARSLRTGQVDINGGAFNALAPFGGFKQSGHGRELGRYGLDEFTTTKSLQL